MNRSYTITHEQIELDARMGWALAFEPPLNNTGDESLALEMVGLANSGMPRRIRAGGKDYLPFLWTSSADGRYVESNISRNSEAINKAMSDIAAALGGNTIIVPVEA